MNFKLNKPSLPKTTTPARVAGVLLAVLLLLGLLAGCSSRSSSAKTLADNFENTTLTEGGSLGETTLHNVVKMLISVYADADFNAEKPAKFDVQDYLIAASRGYDMLAEGFDDEKADPEVNGTADPVATAVKVIDKANEIAISDKTGKEVDRSGYETINATDLKNLIACFQTTVDTSTSGGGLDVILIGIGKALGWITNTIGFGSYLVGICIFAVLIEILLIPLAIRQQKNSIRQAKLRPKEMAIRKKYAGRTDQKTQQEVTKEIQELYQRENFSPYSGCLPLLLQLPILMALYQIVINPLHYVLGQSGALSTALTQIFTASRAAGGLGQKAPSGTIQLLSKGKELFTEGLVGNFKYFTNGKEVWDAYANVRGNVPNFSLFGLDLGQTPGFTGSTAALLWIPVLTFVVYFFSMRLNRKFSYQPTQAGATDRQTACSNNMMDVSMPLMSTFFTFVVPGIIGVYWIFRSLLGVLKQFIMSKVMPLPVFTEEDYKAAAREMAGKKPKAQKSENAGRVRSLHHIDDEDFDDTREAALARKAAIAELEQKEQEARAGSGPVESAELKEDNRSGNNKNKD